MKSLIIALLVAAALAACPKLCSGHGDCGEWDKCTCWSNWMGADCSQRVCPFGKAFVRLPDAVQDEHYYDECSGKGLCDRATGECVCFDGYEGSSCQRTVCPNGCSNHGVCKYIEDLGQVTAYGEWDESKTQMCVCDGGYEGPDCSQRICPQGNDPLTQFTDSVSETLQFKVMAPRTLDDGYFYFSYVDMMGNLFNTSTIEYTAFVDGSDEEIATEAAIVAALKSLPNKVFDSVTVEINFVAATSFTVDVTFTSAFTTGTQDLKLIVAECNMAGCQPKASGVGQADFATILTTPWPLACVLTDGSSCDTTIITGLPAPAGAILLSTLPDMTCPLVLQMLMPGASAGAMSYWQYRWCDKGDWTAVTGTGSLSIAGVTISVAGCDDLDDDTDATGGTPTIERSLPVGTKLYMYPFVYSTASVAGKLTAMADNGLAAPNVWYMIQESAVANFFSWTKAGMIETVTNKEAGATLTLENTITVTVSAVDIQTAIYIVPNRIAVATFITRPATSENAVCSNRGLCNQETGLCECFEGYRGESCNGQTILV